MRVSKRGRLVKMRATSPRAMALRLLARRARSVTELRQALLARRVAAPAVEEELKLLAADRLVDDDQFARDLVESVLARKPVGRRWVQARLHRAGIVPETAARLLAELFSPERERALAEQAARAKGAALALTGVKSAGPARAALARFLLARGFPSPLVREVVSSAVPITSTGSTSLPYTDDWSEPSPS